MECPVCGETLPLSSKICPSCGHEYDGFFLTEEFKSSDLQKRASKTGKAPKVPSALKPGRHPRDVKKIAFIVGGLAVLIAIGVLVLLLVSGGKNAVKKPSEAVTKYYEYLKAGNSSGLFDLFESGFQPTENVRTGLEAALATNTYEVKGPEVTTPNEEGDAVFVQINNVDVTTTPKSGAAPKSNSLAAYGPGSVSVVKVIKTSGGWKISGRAHGGWAPNNLWLIGDVRTP